MRSRVLVYWVDTARVVVPFTVVGAVGVNDKLPVPRLLNTISAPTGVAVLVAVVRANMYAEDVSLVITRPKSLSAKFRLAVTGISSSVVLPNIIGISCPLES